MTLTIKRFALFADTNVWDEEQRQNTAETDQSRAEQRKYPRRVFELLKVGWHPLLHDLRVDVVKGGVNVGAHVAHDAEAGV